MAGYRVVLATLYSSYYNCSSASCLSLWLLSRDIKKRKKQNECAPSEDSDQPGIRLVWSESSLCAQWVAKDPSFLHADSEDSDQTADAQADLSLHWAHSHFVGFVMSRLILFKIAWRTSAGKELNMGFPLVLFDLMPSKLFVFFPV